MTPRVRAFELWMLSNLVTGAVMGAFVVLLIPPFITKVTGSAARAGVVFAVISPAALSGPVFGRIADRYHAHRLVYSLSFVGMALAFAIFAVDDAHDIYSPIAGILLGASLSAKGSVGSGFLVGSGLPEEVQSRQLTVFNLLIFGGQILGGLLVAGLNLAGVGFRGQFWTAALLIAAGAVLTALTTAEPARRIRDTTDAAERARAKVLISAAPGIEPDECAPAEAPQEDRTAFVALLAVVSLGAVGLSILSSQVATSFRPFSTSRRWSPAC